MASYAPAQEIKIADQIEQFVPGGLIIPQQTGVHSTFVTENDGIIDLAPLDQSGGFQCLYFFIKTERASWGNLFDKQIRLHAKRSRLRSKDRMLIVFQKIRNRQVFRGPRRVSGVWNLCAGESDRPVDDEEILLALGNCHNPFVGNRAGDSPCASIERRRLGPRHFHSGVIDPHPMKNRQYVLHGLHRGRRHSRRAENGLARGGLGCQSANMRRDFNISG